MPALPVLIAHAHPGLRPGAEIRGEINAPLAALQNAMGRAPTQVGGHQHVHHLLVLQTMVLDVVDQLHSRPTVRAPGRVAGPELVVKRWLIRQTAGRALACEFRRRALAHHQVLLGVYAFQQPDDRVLVQGLAGCSSGIRAKPLCTNRPTRWAHRACASWIVWTATCSRRTWPRPACASGISGAPVRWRGAKSDEMSTPG